MIDNKIKEKINSVMENKPNINMDELIKIVELYAPKPDAQKLINQEYRRIAQRLMASYRDESGIRDCFSVKSEGSRKYVNVSRTTNKADLQKVRSQLSKRYRGLNKSLRKIDAREQLINGQLEIDMTGSIKNAN